MSDQTTSVEEKRDAASTGRLVFFVLIAFFLLYVANYVPNTIIINSRSYLLGRLFRQPSWLRMSIGLGVFLLSVALIFLTRKEPVKKLRKYFMITGVAGILTPLFSVIYGLMLVTLQAVMGLDEFRMRYGWGGPTIYQLLLAIAPAIFLYGAVGVVMNLSRGKKKGRLEA